MTKRIKRLIKQREGLLEQVRKHQQKIETKKRKKRYNSSILERGDGKIQKTSRRKR